MTQTCKAQLKSTRTAVGVPKLEAKLQRLLVSALGREPLKRGLRRVICSEVDVSHGIADVVVAIVIGNYASRVWLAPLRLKSLNLTTAKLLSQLRYNAYRPLAEIARATGFSAQTISAHLRTLERLGLGRRAEEQTQGSCAPPRRGF